MINYEMKMVFLQSALLGLAFASTIALAADPARVVVPINATYANLAWGFNNGGHDSTTGQVIVLVDLDEGAPLVPGLKASGHIVQCYFSVGTAETWRPDYSRKVWKSVQLGLDPTWDEYYLDLTQIDKVKALMYPRFLRAKNLGCDAIEPDNTECNTESRCFRPIKKKDPNANVRQLQIDYNKWQVQTAHDLGMAISLKNSLSLIPDLVDIYDFAVNEQCQQYDECDSYATFFAQNKPVFNHEYALGSGSVKCDYAAQHLGLRTKRCAGNSRKGICKPGSTWLNCFSPWNPIPAISHTPGGTPAPVVPPTSFAPTMRPTTLQPTKRPKTARPTTLHPTKKPKTSSPIHSG